MPERSRRQRYYIGGGNSLLSSRAVGAGITDLWKRHPPAEAPQ